MGSDVDDLNIRDRRLRASWEWARRRTDETLGTQFYRPGRNPRRGRRRLQKKLWRDYGYLHPRRMMPWSVFAAVVPFPLFDAKPVDWRAYFGTVQAATLGIPEDSAVYTSYLATMAETHG